jgi:Arc/MetJ-type ribon-helix-helix transcriptional regulator
LKKENASEAKYGCRAGLRLKAKEKEQLELLVQKGSFKSISQVIRAALAEYLSRQAVREANL